MKYYWACVPKRGKFQVMPWALGDEHELASCPLFLTRQAARAYRCADEKVVKVLVTPVYPAVAR